MSAEQQLVSRGTPLGVGRSESSSWEAGRDAVRASLCGRRGARGDLIVVFASDVQEVNELHRGACMAAGEAQVVGCTGNGVFTHDALLPRGCVAAHLPAGEACFGVAHAEIEDGMLARAAREAALLARERAGVGRRHSVLMLITPGRPGDQQEVVRGAYEITGARVPIVGGVAGTTPSVGETYQFVEHRTLMGAVVAVWITRARPLGVGVRHGWRPFGRPLLVSRAEGNMIWELDGQPALEMYAAECWRESGIDRPTLSSNIAERFLGLPNASGRYDVRHIIGEQDGGLRMFAYVPEHSFVQAMDSDGSQLLEGARIAAEEASAQLGRASVGSLTFSCAGRVPVLAGRIGEEAPEISRALQGTPTCGFFTCGEFARVAGSTGFHNATVAILAM